MKKKKTWMVVVSICLCMQSLTACGTQPSAVSGKIHIGVAYYDKSDTFISELNACFREKLQSSEKDKMEIVTTFMDAEGSQKTQNDQVEELLDMGCDILCINLVDRADPSDIIDLAKDRNVPIIFYNREPVAEDLRQWDGLYYVGADAKQSGVLQGELAAAVIKNTPEIDRNKDGKIQYVVLEGEPGHQDSIIRTENAVDTLKKSGVELEKLSYQIANWNRAQAQNRMEQLISQYHNDIELVLSNNDDMALGAIDEYERENYSAYAMPVFFGIDGTDIGLKAVLEEKLAGTVYNDKEGQAEAMAQLAIALATGEGLENIAFENEQYLYMSYKKVTKDNVSSFWKSNMTGSY